MPLSIADFPFFRNMGRERLDKGAAVIEPARGHSFDQMCIIRRARMDAHRFWCGVNVSAPYLTPYENQAWSGIVGDEIDGLSKFGEPIRPAKLRIK